MSALTAAQEGRNNGLGILAMVAGIFCMATMDALAKWLGESYSLSQIVFFRALFAIPPVLILAHFSGGLRLLKTQRPMVHIFRGVCTAVAIFSFFASLRVLPLAEAWAIAFAAPLIVTALSMPLLGEPVGWRRWSGVLIGFLGVLIVVRPGMTAFQPAALLALATAVGYALVMITGRKYATTESTAALVFYTTLIPLALAGTVLPMNWQTPVGGDWALFVILGTLGGLAMLLLTQAFRLAQAAVVVPFDYTAMIWSVAWGWLLWRDLPDAMAWAGAALIIVSGLYVAHREAQLRRQRGRHLD